MARNIKIVFNKQGIANLLSSDELARDLKERAERIQVAAEEVDEASKFEVQSWIALGSSKLSRAMARVVTSNYAARRAEAETRILVKSLDAGRG